MKFSRRTWIAGSIALPATTTAAAWLLANSETPDASFRHGPPPGISPPLPSELRKYHSQG